MLTYVWFSLSLRNGEELPSEGGIDICHETVRFCWDRFGPIFAGEMRQSPVSHTVRGNDRAVAAIHERRVALVRGKVQCFVPPLSETTRDSNGEMSRSKG